MRTRRSTRRRSRALPFRPSATLNLIALMDILATLLLFLLKSYASGGDVATPPPGLQLPASSAEQEPAESIVIAIERGAILFGNEPLATVEDVLASRDDVIAPLAERLDAARAQQDDLDRRAGREPSDHAVTIQGDRDIEYRLLRKVMLTLHQRGFENVALAVLRAT